MRRITLKDIFLKYPHKCQEIYGNTIPMPYVPKQEIDCEHLYSQTYKEWQKIVDTYLNNVVLYMMEGNTFSIPKKLGRLEIKKCKSTYKDFNTGEDKSNRYLKNNKIIIKWFRKSKDNGIFRFKWLWRIRLTKKKWTQCMEILKKDLTHINKLKNA